MAAVLDFSSKRPRRFGQVRKEYQFPTSLLEKRSNVVNEARPKTPDIFAPPQDSSDEASVAAEEGGNYEKVASNANGPNNGSRSPGISIPGNRTRSITQHGQRESSMELSTIPASQFKSLNQSDSFNVSQDSHRRRKDVISEDEEDMSGIWTQPKRRKTGYGSSSQRSSQNIHHGSPREHKEKTSKLPNFSDSTDGKPGLRLLKGTENAIARGM